MTEELPNCETNSCGYVCSGIPNCVPEVCTAVSFILAVSFGLLAIPIFVRLVQFQLYSTIPRWSLKKLLYISLLLVCLCRSIGYTLQLTFSDSYTTSLVFFLFFFWYGLYFLFVAYSLLLAFWWHMCQKKMPFSWLGRRMRIILLISNFIVGLLLAAMVGFHFLPNRRTSILASNAVILTIILTLCGAYLREGVKFYRLLKTFTLVKPLMTKLTVILISSSATLIISFLVLILATAIRATLLPNSNVACQISQAIYRSIEFSVIILLGYPLRTYKEQVAEPLISR